MNIEHIKTQPPDKGGKLFVDMHLDGDTPLQQAVSESFMSNFRWLLDGGLDQLSYEHYKLFGCYRGARKVYDIEYLIATAVPKTVGDEEKKLSQRGYYDANSLILEYVLREVFTLKLFKELGKLDDRDKRAVQMRYRDILQTLMLDRQNLINAHGKVFGDGKYAPTSHHISSVGMHNALRQSIYGNLSFNSFADYEPGAGMAVVRQLVELRVRRAFGILGYITNQGGVQPIAMSSIFEVLKRHQITSSPNIHSIERIYSFPNIYMHSGEVPYSWYPIFFEYVLRPISFDYDEQNGIGYSWDVNNAITVTRSELEAIQAEVLALKADAKELISCKPECKVVDV